jgi:hypothetical protein
MFSQHLRMKHGGDGGDGGGSGKSASFLTG